MLTLCNKKPCILKSLLWESQLGHILFYDNLYLVIAILKELRVKRTYFTLDVNPIQQKTLYCKKSFMGVTIRTNLIF